MHEFRPAAVLSGHRQAVKRVIRMTKEKGAKYTYLNVSAPFLDDMISIRTIPDCITPVFLPGCRMADHFRFSNTGG
ncbi:hypothetical protein B4144_2060 [Bacillus atrophaeus]|nr:hypothetical protein B4144_2060 [Bacillus atrophaeus]